MGTQYLIDTNVVIEFLGNALPTSGSKWLQNIIDHGLHHLSVINQIELLGYNGTRAEMQPLEDFIDASNMLSLSDAVVQQTINLRKEHKIKLPDAIIAATALVNKCDLITRNSSDFNKIKHLNVLNPHAQ